MTRPLDNIVIADFSHVMAGPYASYLLGLLGARIIKIESPSGDNFRTYGADRRFDGMSPAFIGANVGKESIVLDLKDAGDAATAREIVARADVLLENFRPGVIARLGFGYDAVRAYNPDIVYCSVSGYGQTGPQQDWPAIDNIVQATSGMMMLSGDEGEAPIRVGFPIVDTLTGQTAAFAILAALYRRMQGSGGECLDVAMFDATLAFMSSAVVPHLVTGTGLPRSGNVGFSGQPTAGVFVAGDGRHLSLGVVQPHQFAALARHIGRDDWLADPRYATADGRREHGTVLAAELTLALQAKPASEWERSMNAAGIPCGMVRGVGEAVAMLEQSGRGDLVNFDPAHLPPGARGRITGLGYRAADRPESVAPPPPLGGNGESIRAWLAETGTRS
ncbi:CaiB/BaiF CoA-transferase family protein [Sphingomonas sp. SUN039]|uniref:CaiB/BaiF CoA transferase family protein n=1 Tax=Sphingomonas sp. SUN039 TaxID=2937787 RepID=UPI0021641B3F|nr:CoA transferase [Sphingomonas sp. SUN039]UVO54390.1 CoA transferase [Sphingomonas sp. SUN039]